MGFSPACQECIEDVRKMTEEKGLKCTRSHFFRIIRNPVYCGLIPIKSNEQEQHMVKGIHDPLISEALFYEVQRIIKNKRRITAKAEDRRATFFLVGFLICPHCKRKFTGRFHRDQQKISLLSCRGRCKTRINTDVLNQRYVEKLQQLTLASEATDLFNRVLQDWNTSTQKRQYVCERQQIVRRLNE